MIRGDVDRMFNWKTLGTILASLSDIEQVEFFQGFASEVGLYPTAYAQEMQMISINRKLTTKERELYATIGYQGE